MTSASAPITRPVPFALALGALGGAALVATEMLTTRGPLIFLPYAALVLATVALLRHRRVRPYGRRFGAALGAFMGATAVLYAYVVAAANPSALGMPLLAHAWRLGLMLAIGAALSAAAAYVSDVVE